MARTKQIERVGVIAMDDDGNDAYVPSSLFATDIDIDSREAWEIFHESLKHLSREELETDLFNALPEYGSDSSLSFSDRCHADVCFSLREERGNSHDVKNLTLQLILTFAFLHLCPVERKRFVERHTVVESVVVHINEDSSDNVSISSTSNEDSSDNVSTSSKSSYAYNDSDEDKSIGTTNGPAIGCLEVYEPASESEPESELDFIPLPEVEEFPRVFTSGTQICRPEEDPKGTLPFLTSRVRTTHVGRRVYTSGELTGPVEPEQVGTI